jgi:hypothetical protein
MINHRSRIELARQATAILRAANCDTVTGEKKSSQQARRAQDCAAALA